MKAITIAGGGLAGLTLGICLRQQSVPVTVLESGHYPRHRVCGEFISGNGLRIIERLGLLPRLRQAGAHDALTASFSAGDRQSPVRTLPSPAVCVSRFVIDASLAAEFSRLGGSLRENCRWTPGPPADGLVRATGRKPQPASNGWRWFGLKVHATNLPLHADVEMHISQHGYVGVNRINREEVNVCGLFRSPVRSGSDSREGPTPPARAEWLRDRCGDALRERLGSARFDDTSFCAVAGLSLTPRRAADDVDCCVGDAVTMIPPVTGNGMSMAIESADMATTPLVRYSRGELSWDECRQQIAAECDGAFAARLRWARGLQGLAFSPLVRTPSGAALLNSDRLWNLFFARTR
jgi:2-polyprenyl-6-methoxyphenol hydroxylase-like FAD-dependent oxidoreductase